MRTLDEVIKALECCDNGEPDSNCEECSYNGLGLCCLERKNDAFYYLKKYRNLMKQCALYQIIMSGFIPKITHH